MGYDRFYEEETKRIYGKNDLEKLQKVFDQIGVKYSVSHQKETDRTNDHYEVYLDHYVFFFDKDGKFDGNTLHGVA